MAQQTNAVVYPQKIIVIPSTRKVQVIGAAPGPQGPPGPVVNLGALTDVNVSSVANGDGIAWDLATGMWIPSPNVKRTGDTMTGRLILATEEVTLAALTGSLIIGSTIGWHLAFDDGEIQSKSNPTTASYLNLNPHGGTVIVGTGGLASNGTITVLDTEEVNSANYTGGIIIGAFNDPHLAMDTNEIQAKTNNNTMAALSLNPHGGAVIIGDGNGAGSVLAIGDDTVFVDANGANALRLQGVADPTVGVLYLGSGLAHILGSATDVAMKSPAGGAGYVDADTINLRSSAAATRLSVGVGAAFNISYMRTIVDQTVPGSGVWSDSQLLLQSPAAGWSQIAFHNSNGQAPIICQDTGSGERLLFLNSGRSAWIPLLAGAFTVSSSEKVKDDIVPLAGTDALSVAKAVEPIRFRRKEARHTRPTAQFLDVNERWVASGKSPLQPKPNHFEPDPDRPNLEEVGLSAEQMVSILPGAVHYTEGEPVGIDIAQVASIALAGVGELVRRVEMLEATIEVLSKNK